MSSVFVKFIRLIGYGELNSTHGAVAYVKTCYDVALFVNKLDAMFDFFFKKRYAAKLSELVSVQKKQEEQKKAASAAAQFSNRQSKKQLELDKSASFAGQEQAALAFILSAEFADARLQAATHIHSPEVLMQVSGAMRNTDRRVTKLVQEKLAKLQNQQKMELALEACLLQAQQLLANPHLMVNQVAEWDKVRVGLETQGVSSGVSSEALVTMKLELERRLQIQLDLQRRSIQIAQALRSLVETDLPLVQLQAQLDDCSQQWQELQSNEFAVSLPKSQITQLNSGFSQAQSHVQHRADSARAVPVEPIPEVNVYTTLEVENKPEIKEVRPQKSAIDVKSHLTSLEAALEEGSLQQALDVDKLLRTADVTIRGDIAQRLQAARAELNRLLDWAKWGGNISREELIKVASTLSIDDSSATEIAKQVGGLRARWKELDRTSGSAPKLVWIRFDEACNKAYQIADAHFKQQAQSRLDNLSKAQAQLAALDTFIAALQNPSAPSFEWKAHQSYIDRAKLEWRKLGTIDRKFKTNLESEFSQKIGAIKQPLTMAREAAMAVRQQLIRSVAAIAPNDRDAAEQVQQVQQQWQQEALNLSLERKEEQELWRQFRTACDNVFAQRKAHAEEQNQRRDQVVSAKQVCCEGVEKCAQENRCQTSAEIALVLKKARQEWKNLSNQLVGKNKQTNLDVRFEAAVSMLEKRQSEVVEQERQAELSHLRDKIKLCRQLEGGDASNDSQREGQNKLWKALATKSLPVELNRSLTQRFNNAVQGVKVGDVESANANVAQMEEIVLRLEMLRGLPSPSELAQQRLELQVKDLQSALKNRGTSNTYLALLCALCAMPVTLDARLEERFQAILGDYDNQLP